MSYWKKEGLLFIVSAPSGAGKTTLCKELAGVMPTLAHSVSHTTRKPRPGEVEGEHYYFIDEPAFKGMAESGGFVEWATVHGHLYGTSKAELERLFGQGLDVILDIDTQGAMQVMNSRMKGVFIFILPPSMQELENRLRGRSSDGEEEIQRRLKNAVAEIKSYRYYNYIIINDNILSALEALKAIVMAEKSRISNIDEQWVKENFPTIGGN
ncbi:MAG: guanylate kinase [Nitrospirota bacterium]